MAVKDKSSAKQVRDIKSEDAPKQIEINPGNVSILTVKLLDDIATSNRAILAELRKNNG